MLPDFQLGKEKNLAPLKYPTEQGNVYYNDFLVLLKNESGLNIYNFDIKHNKSDNMVDAFLRELEISVR